MTSIKVFYRLQKYSLEYKNKELNEIVETGYADKLQDVANITLKKESTYQLFRNKTIWDVFQDVKSKTYTSRDYKIDGVNVHEYIEPVRRKKDGGNVWIAKTAPREKVVYRCDKIVQTVEIV